MYIFISTLVTPCDYALDIFVFHFLFLVTSLASFAGYIGFLYASKKYRVSWIVDCVFPR
jgi:hypothetical protein